jgi:hypothetical protein
MGELISSYRSDPEVLGSVGVGPLDQLRQLTLTNALRSAVAMSDSLDYYDEADEKMPVRESSRIFELSSDRVGFGKHSTNINVNVDFASQLDRAIAASSRVRTIDARPTNVQEGVLLPSPQPKRPALEGVNSSGDRQEWGEDHRGDSPRPVLARRF